MSSRVVLAIVFALALLSCFGGAAHAQQSDMTFFVTSAGSGKGADLGGAVNARDRIGSGPWQNAKGTVVAKSPAELHGTNNISKQTALTEKGEMEPDGTAFAGAEDRTCGNWTKSTQGSAMVGHHDRQGLRDDDASKSWNSSHPSRSPDGGCSQNDLKSTGGNGFFYCFAIK
jgi:hypothetical protein